MSMQRVLRAPVLRALERQQPMAFRAAAIAPFSTKPTIVSRQAPVQQQQQSPIKQAWFAAPPAPGKNMVSAKAAMPQLVPFFFVNEVAFAFTIMPALVYVFSKYILPSRLRLYATRVFMSKL